ncbi:hypothetical protein [Gordonia iterans]
MTTSWEDVARQRRRRETLNCVGVLAFSVFFAVGAVLFAGDPADRWWLWTAATLSLFMVGLAAGVLTHRLGLVPRQLHATLTETPSELSMVPQQSGRAAFGMGPAALAWTAAALTVTLAPSSVFPWVMASILWVGSALFVLLMLVSIRWSMSEGTAEQRIDYRLFSYTDRIERIDELSYQQDKNWLWVHGPAIRTWTVFGRTGHPAVRTKTILVLADLPSVTPGELAATIEHHAGRSIHIGPLPGEFG